MIMKPLGRKNYGSIPHLSGSKLGPGDHYIHEGQERILTEKARDHHDHIIVTEKYDGSNVGVCRKNGQILALTRAGYLASSSPYKQHHLFAEWVEKSISDGCFDFLEEGERVAGEWMAQAHGIKYDIQLLADPIVFFDLFDSENNRMSFWKMDEILENNGLISPRLIHYGSPKSVIDLLFELDKADPLFSPEDKPEGMVFRCERHGAFEFMAKWVRPDFEPGKYIINVPDEEAVWNI